MVTALPWVILLAPIAACGLILLVGMPRPRLASRIAVTALVAGFAASIVLLIQLLASHEPILLEHTIPWVTMDGLRLELGVIVDHLAVMMLLVVTGVGSAIFIYSTGYMAEDPSYPRYFACLALFAFSMLGIVLANNFIMLFMFWELVGVSSYLLIGFWFEKPAAAEAGKKAFLVNRVADFGLILGILLLWTLSGATGQERTLNFVELEHRLHDIRHLGGGIPAGLGAAGLLIFCGVLGKSAQFPLHVWLPDAMEGPTPVSALIHAATMVAAGVYLLARCFFLYAQLPDALTVIAYLGGFTAIFAASIAVVQDDIKRILAYSTLSQLGYMVMAIGLGGYAAGMYHLTTHAFFKALLFLGAGCMIHALHTNNIWEMGGLRRAMPITSWTFLVGTLALCGIWPLAGFWSKDEILTLAYLKDPVLWVTGSLTAMLTAFYMGRLCFAAIFGAPRGAHAGREAPVVMTGPLVFLALLTIAGGFFGIPAFVHHHQGVHVKFNPTVAAVSTACALIGLTAAWRLYGTGALLPSVLKYRLRWVHTLLVRKFYMDELYLWIIRNIQQRIATLCNLFERYVIMRLFVNGAAMTTRAAGYALRFVQTGRVQTYALELFTGLIVIISLMMFGKVPSG